MSMKFRTEIEKIGWKSPIEYSSHILTLGSCFAERISSILSERKFSVTALPTGILFNPASIAQSINLMASRHKVLDEELMEVDGRWLSYNFHSSISSTTRQEARVVMQEAIDRGGEALDKATHLIITLGTAWVYRLRESGSVVANCHKQSRGNGHGLLLCRWLGLHRKLQKILGRGHRFHRKISLCRRMR